MRNISRNENSLKPCYNPFVVNFRGFFVSNDLITLTSYLNVHPCLMSTFIHGCLCPLSDSLNSHLSIFIFIEPVLILFETVKSLPSHTGFTPPGAPPGAVTLARLRIRLQLQISLNNSVIPAIYINCTVHNPF